MFEVTQLKTKNSARCYSKAWMGFAAIFACILAIYGWPGSAAATLSQIPNQDTWTTNGTVNAVATDGTTTYIGGSFTYVGPSTGSGAPIDLTTGSVLSVFPKVAGSISVVAADGVGGWFIGGMFSKVGGVARNNIAHILADGTLDSLWDPSATRADSAITYVNSLAVNGGVVYVGGDFTNIGGQSRNYLAALDASTGNATSWNPNPGSSVNALAVSGSTVYVGGTFGTIGGQARVCLAALEASTGNATPWNPGANGVVSALAISGGTIYAGGWFTVIAGQNRNHIAAINTSTAQATSWDPNASDGVYTLALSGGTVYATGAFTTIGGQPRNCLAAIDASTGNATPWDPNLTTSAGNNDTWLDALAVNGGTVYVAGQFSGTIGGQPRNYLAAIDASTGNATPWNPNPSGRVDALAISGGTIYAGGNFTSLGGVARNGLAALDTATGIATSWNPNATGGLMGMSANVFTLALSGGTVYAGGNFTSMGGQSRNLLAALDASTGNVTSWNPNVTTGDSDMDAGVSALVVSGGKVYFGGQFSGVGGQTRNSLAAVDTSTGNVSSWNPNVTCSNLQGNCVSALAASNGKIYIGGTFSSVGGQSRNSIAAIDASTGNVTSWNPDATGSEQQYVDTAVRALAVSGSTIYAGGNFTSIGGQSRSSLAAIDASTGDATPWNPGVSGGDYITVSALAVSGSTVFAGGYFDSIGGQSRSSLAAIDASTGNADSWNPGVAGFVGALVVKGTSLHVGGDFYTIGNDQRPNYAQFDGLDVPSLFSISGAISAAGSPLPGVSVALSGAATSSTTTGSDGTYAFSDLDSGVYTITPTKTQYSFSPAQRTANLNGSNLTGQDFNATLPQAGTLKVTLAPATAVSAGAQWKVDDGDWQNSGATVSSLTAGSHSLTFKDITGWTTPAPQTVTIANGKPTNATATYQQQSAPGAPSILSVTAGDSQVTVNFKAPTSDGGSPITSYTAVSSPDGKTATGSGTPLVVTGLRNGTAYTFTVTATNALGPGHPSAKSKSVKPVGPTVPGAPAILSVTAGDSQVTVNFKAPTSDGGSPITSYTAVSSPDGKTATGSGTPLVVTGLRNGTAYTFTVTATNAIGPGHPSAKSRSVKPTAPK